ncbi:MAG: hypothetical protein ACHP9U_06950, partial [Steroidobacterales bacterium]
MSDPRGLSRDADKRRVRLSLGAFALLMLAGGGTRVASATPAVHDGISARPPRAVVAGVPFAPTTIQTFAHRVIATRDNDGMPYVVIDKLTAQVFVFDAGGNLQASAAALLGLARGDRSIPGVGDKKLSAIRPQERITPAGRFVASLGHDTHGQQILWIDYRDAIALHPVVKGTPQERRAERLNSATSQDNRISYGCINVPRLFYNTFVSAAFAHTSGIVYILPELATTPGLL